MDIVPQLIINSIIAGAIYSLIALGFNLIYGTGKFFDLGYGALTAVGGYGVYYLYKSLGLSLFPSVIFSIIFSALIGFVVYKLVYAPLIQRKSSTMVMLVASLGVLTVIQAIIAILFSSQFQTLTKNSGVDHVYNIFGGVMSQVQLITLILSVVVLIIITLIFKFTIFGKSIKAVGDDEEVSKIVGINTGRILSYVFMIGSAIAGLAGIMIGFDTGIEPTMGLSLLLKGVIASIIGGVGNAYGGFLGAFILAFAENFGIWHISGEWKDAIAFVILILFLLFRPKGIFRR
jgi:branched-chain amino acid transport system permease protein